MLNLQFLIHEVVSAAAGGFPPPDITKIWAEIKLNVYAVILPKLRK